MFGNNKILSFRRPLSPYRCYSVILYILQKVLHYFVQSASM